MITIQIQVLKKNSVLNASQTRHYLYRNRNFAYRSQNLIIGYSLYALCKKFKIISDNATTCCAPNGRK